MGVNFSIEIGIVLMLSSQIAESVSIGPRLPMAALARRSPGSGCTVLPRAMAGSCCLTEESLLVNDRGRWPVSWALL